jgi:soluble lytic murein transglycosylase
LCLALDEPNHVAKLTPAQVGHKPRWHLRAFREQIEREAFARELDPTHLWALMYTESRFRPHVVSHVGARGALQIMPWTGRQLEERLGLLEPGQRFDPDRLYDIDVNAKLAVAYVHELAFKFHGQLPLAYASYNGGPSNVERWLEGKAAAPEARPLQMDDFIEEISFEETYRYTRRVMEVQATYALLYTGELPTWRKDVDPRVEGNISF